MHGILLGSGAFLCPDRRSSSVHPTLKLTLRINISRGAPDRYAGLSHLRYARRPEKRVANAKAWLCKVAKRYECQFLTYIWKIIKNSCNKKTYCRSIYNLFNYFLVWFQYLFLEKEALSPVLQLDEASSQFPDNDESDKDLYPWQQLL